MATAPRRNKAQLAQEIQRLEFTYRCLNPEQQARSQDILERIEQLRRKMEAPDPPPPPPKKSPMGKVMLVILALAAALAAGFGIAAISHL